MKKIKLAIIITLLIAISTFIFSIMHNEETHIITDIIEFSEYNDI